MQTLTHDESQQLLATYVPLRSRSYLPEWAAAAGDDLSWRDNGEGRTCDEYCRRSPVATQSTNQQACHVSSLHTLPSCYTDRRIINCTRSRYVDICPVIKGTVRSAFSATDALICACFCLLLISAKLVVSSAASTTLTNCVTFSSLALYCLHTWTSQMDGRTDDIPWHNRALRSIAPWKRS